HARRASHRRARPGRGRRVRVWGRRRRDRDRRLRERPRGGAGLRPHRSRLCARILMDHAFGTSEPFTLGIEEELLLVDPETRRLAPVAADVLQAIDAHERAASHEVYAASIELRSPPRIDAEDAGRELAGLRGAARRAGATLMGAGVHPDGALGDAALVDSERYRLVGGTMRGLMRRTPECALHVHVGMPDEETAVRVFNGIRS